ncbi:MAG: FtsQ-type POTRA domain-containing protein [Candidatus Pacebacteria bacterium]|nr:FtsQ-type POTRA domain-containing protein [Candidatus Paceibacterota bacterium]
MIRPRKFRTKDARRRERVRVVLRAGAMFVGIFLFLGVGVYILHQPFLRISGVTFSTDGSLPETELTKAVQDMLSGSIFGILPKDFVFFVSKKTIEENLRVDFPRIADITVVREGFTQLAVAIHERTPSALWCGDVVPVFTQDTLSAKEYVTQEQGSCYLVDAGGYLYDHAPVYSDDSFIRYYGSLAHADPIGQVMFAGAEFTEWQGFANLLRESDKPIHAILFVDERDVELYLEHNLRIIVPRTQAKEVTRDRLVATLNSGKVDMTRPIEYIDARFGAKVFVKYVTMENSVPATEE